MVLKGKSTDVWIGWMSILFFGAGVPLFVKQLLDARPRVILDESGVFDRTLGVGTIPWDEITGAYVKAIHGNAFVCLEMHRPDHWLQSAFAAQRALVAANVKLGFQPLNINLSGTAVDPVLVLDIVLKKSAESSRAEG